MIKLMKYFFFLDSTWTKHCQGKGDEIENKCPRLRMVWVSCEGETAADKGGIISEGISNLAWFHLQKTKTLSLISFNLK